MNFRLMILTLVLIVSAAATVKAQEPIYSNIPNPVPLNVFSQGPEAYAFTEIGDGFTLAGKNNTLKSVSVVLSSWGCQAGAWNNGPGPLACVTVPGATFSVPVTVNVYSVTDSGTSLEGAPAQAPLTLLATLTENFKIPYRPSSSFVNCPASAAISGSYYNWYDYSTETCQNGIDTPITFDLSSLRVKLPSQIIVAFSYNTTHYGPHPIGVTACNATSEGCFYDSLNVSGGSGAAAYPGPILAPSVGSVLNVNGIFTAFANANTAFCGTGTLPANTLALDASPGCYTGNHPMIAINASR